MTTDDDNAASFGRSVNLGSCIYGIPIKAHWSFFALLGVVMLSGIIRFDPLYLALVFLLYGPILLITVIVHELGHAITTKKLGGTVGGIVLWPLGGFAMCGPTSGGAREDFLVSLAGPLSHLPQMLFWLALYVFTSGGDFVYFRNMFYISSLHDGAIGFFSTLFAQGFFLNVELLVFNLLIPAYPLDGGRCMASILIMCGVEIKRAAMATSFTAIVISSVLAVWGAVSTFVYDNTGGIFLVFVGLYIFAASKLLLDLARQDRLQEHPLFGRACYRQQAAPTASGSSARAPGNVSSPTDPASAEESDIL
mmetsp:Transcript_44963/g.66166  ORF Transcript_44963/g.66166 Transcript_44963/m.66166 type:complete len:308 (+) Transcript_44963:210-1133(+)|eukprot:CAMPEP_0195523640 /NCGR_PEP_ID=MMETSP0794_2-20130614/22956_1 /TAXON_ID=515487 /ORGANISM="Stephanopyxis turris, Strain CCMP 815" /LENGTH=307 /DNA_ID=CAMNT_0040653677 /DNA_START=204 /DNA_END=1127 /DNA_ORIENTATION=+